MFFVFCNRVFITSKEFVSIATEKEKWFGTQYKQDYLPEELIKSCATCELTSELHLPQPNEYIPTNFHLHSTQKNILQPQLPKKIKVNISIFVKFHLILFDVICRKMNCIVFIMLMIHFINYLKLIYISNYESNIHKVTFFLHFSFYPLCFISMIRF